MFHPSPFTRSAEYQKNCLTSPILSSLGFAGVFAALDSARGAQLTPRLLGTYFAGMYLYSAVQCPMEAVHGRQSLLHNVISGGAIGYIGVQRGMLGIPFLQPHVIYGSRLPPAAIAFLVYGAMAGVLATISGKRL